VLDATLDPVTLAVLKGRLEQIADEMDATLYRSAFNPIIAEAHDACHGLYDAASGDTLVQGKSGLPVFVGAMAFAVRAAINAAATRGGIGSHFPPSDPQWKGADSSVFLTHAARLLRRAGGAIDFVDCTVICEAPKIGPHRDAIRSRVAGILAIPVGSVSIKATTTERLGFTGRREGIAAQAVASIRMPPSGNAREGLD
jgi:2-C-methyl-D-erythritol 2,4-cyclodiphosphate synthase